MIHLIGKLYITSDRKISKDNNRVVISDEFGFPELGRSDENHFDLYEGTLISFSQSRSLPEEYTSWGDMITHLIQVSTAEDKRVYINADTVTATDILTEWYKMLLPNATASNIHNILLAHEFKFRLTEGDNMTPLVTKVFTEYEDVFNATSPMVIDIDYNDVSIEFLLASYINDGSYQNELVYKLRILLNRYAEDITKEFREVHFMSLNVGDTPDEFMTSSALWGVSIGLRNTSILVDKLTLGDIDKFGQYLNTDDIPYLNSNITILTYAVEWGAASQITKTMIDTLLDTETGMSELHIDLSIFGGAGLKDTCNYYLTKDTLNVNTPNMFYE